MQVEQWNVATPIHDRNGRSWGYSVTILENGVQDLWQFRNLCDPSSLQRVEDRGTYFRRRPSYTGGTLGSSTREFVACQERAPSSTPRRRSARPQSKAE